MTTNAPPARGQTLGAVPKPRGRDGRGTNAGDEMSDTMLLGVLRMPIPPQPESMMLTQFVCRAREAADRIESDAKTIAELRAELARALRVVEAAQHAALTGDMDEIKAQLWHWEAGR